MCLHLSFLPHVGVGVIGALVTGSASTSALAEVAKEHGSWKKMMNLIMQLRKVSGAYV